MVVETFNPEKIGRKACFTPLEALFFIEQHIQNPLKSSVGKLFYGFLKFCIIHLFQLSQQITFVIGIIQWQLLIICHNLLLTMVAYNNYILFIM